jgi:hypothetical protein
MLSKRPAGDMFCGVLKQVQHDDVKLILLLLALPFAQEIDSQVW